MNFEFTEQEINLIANAVAEMPFKVAEPVIAKIRDQYEQQAEQPEDSTPTEEM